MPKTTLVDVFSGTNVSRIVSLLPMLRTTFTMKFKSQAGNEPSPIALKAIVIPLHRARNSLYQNISANCIPSLHVLADYTLIIAHCKSSQFVSARPVRLNPCHNVVFHLRPPVHSSLTLHRSFRPISSHPVSSHPYQPVSVRVNPTRSVRSS